MQTFLPHPDLGLSAVCLDNKRLGKQRVEVYQILNALTGKSTGWVNHPATKMWRGYERALAVYGALCCIEWMTRGYKDSLKPIFDAVPSNGRVYPAWFGDDELHDSHKSNLLRKMPLWYSRFGWDVPNDLPYYWPVR